MGEQAEDSKACLLAAPGAPPAKLGALRPTPSA